MINGLIAETDVTVNEIIRLVSDFWEIGDFLRTTREVSVSSLGSEKLQF